MFTRQRVFVSLRDLWSTGGILESLLYSVFSRSGVLFAADMHVWERDGAHARPLCVPS